MSEKLTRREQLKAFGITFSPVIGLGVLFGVSHLGSCFDTRKGRSEIEHRTFRHWNKQNLEVAIGATRFVAKLPFSQGSYLGDGDPAYFPFDVKIDTKNLERLRKAIADVLPETAPLIIIADDPVLKHETRRSMDPDTKATTMAASFDHRIGKQVFWEMRDRTLTNEKVQVEFAQRIEKELLMWMVYEVYVTDGVAKRQKVQPTAKEEELLQEAQREALGIAYTKVLTLPSPFQISTYTAYNYRSHYQQLD